MSRGLLVVVALLGLLSMHGLPAHAAAPADAMPGMHAVVDPGAVQHLTSHVTAADTGCPDHTACVATVRPAGGTAVAVGPVEPAAPVPGAAGGATGTAAPLRAPPDRVDLVALGISRT